mgnify:CR=1 FL=1
MEQQAWDALADPTRRQVFELVARTPSHVQILADKLPVSRPAVSQHLKVLRDAGLVGAKKEGTRQIYFADQRGLAGLRRWMDQFWDEALANYQAEFREGENE